MSKKNKGSLGYQMMKALQGIFRPGISRHEAKRHHRERGLITSISTMRNMSANVHQFARFIRSTWPDLKYLPQVRPEMALVYVQALQDREVSGGTLGRVCATIRKLDFACHKDGTFPPDAPPLLPTRKQGGPGGFHSVARPIPYTPQQAETIILKVAESDKEIARLLTLMWKAGLRVTEAVYLRTQDIDLENGVIVLNATGNVNRTKGGRPRSVKFFPEDHDFFSVLKGSPAQPDSGHLFKERRSLPDRARALVREACRELNLTCLGTHAFRKAFSVENYHQARMQGADDHQALRDTSLQLGHPRAEVTAQSYVSRAERKKGVENGIS